MKREMKKINSILFVSLLFSISGIFSSCVRNEFEDINPDLKNDNPLSGIMVPDGFTSSTTTNVKVDIAVNDEFNGKYGYLVEIFNSNPVSPEKVNAIAAGVIKSNQIFKTEIEIPKAQGFIFVRQTDPRGLTLTRQYPVKDQVVCDFKNFTSNDVVSAKASKSQNRISVTVPSYTSVPAGAVELRNMTTESIQSNTNYVISSDYSGTFAHWGTTGTKLFVTATWTIPSDFTVQNGLQIIVMNGGKVINSNKQLVLIGNETEIVVMQGGEVALNNLDLSNYNEIYNLGKFTAETIKNNPGIFYNGPGAIFNTNTFYAGGGQYLNEGIMNISKFETTWGCKIENKCTINVSGSFIYENGIIDQSKGSIIANNMQFNVATLNLSDGSMIKASSKIDFKDNVAINGSGTTSLVKSPNMECSSGLTFNGTLVVENNSITNGNKWWSPWTLNSPAQMTSLNGSSVNIETCSGVVNTGNTGSEPTNPVIPVVTIDESPSTYIFEDGWPLYGDYDMNDLVIRVNSKTIESDANNKAVSMSMEVELLAAGATKTIAAALQLDNVLASDITETVTYSNTPDGLFILNDKKIEASQENVVIPLFSDAHSFLGSSEHTMINTIKGSKNNVLNTPKVSFKINFPAGKYSASDLSGDKLNFFIITNGKSAKRVEVHVLGFKPTNLVDLRYFGSNNDASSVSGNSYYISQDNLAWGLKVPVDFRYPRENVNIKDAYERFSNWLSTGGVQDNNWFDTFNSTKVF